MNMTELRKAHPARHNGLSNGTTTRTPSKPIRRMRSTSSGSASPSSIPTAHSRVQTNNTYGDDVSIDSGIRVDRDKLEQMAHEVVNIKSMLLKLKRVLEEAETDNPCNCNLNIVLLSAQLEERDSRIERLEEALRRSNEARPIVQSSSPTSRTNVATQTDRIRPLSTGPTLFQTSPENTTTSFVSKNEVSCQRKKTNHTTISATLRSNKLTTDSPLCPI